MDRESGRSVLPSNEIDLVAGGGRLGSGGSFDSSLSATTGQAIGAVPQAVPLSFKVTAGQTFSGILRGTDSDGDTLTFEIALKPLQGTVSVNAATGPFTYASAATFRGVDQFSYRVKDAASNVSAAAIATITVEAAGSTGLSTRRGRLAQVRNA